jgi:hypothetical protein
MGVELDTVCSRLESRHYPFPELTTHFLGDWRTGENFHATNASLVEHDANTKLQGYRDYQELIPLVRYRHHPWNKEMAELRGRDRNVRTSIDIRLQERATEILEKRLRMAKHDKGALVVMDAQSGDVLALVPAYAGGGNGRESGRAAGSRAIRGVSARIDIQAGDGGCGAAGGSECGEQEVPMPAGGRWSRRHADSGLAADYQR